MKKREFRCLKGGDGVTPAFRPRPGGLGRGNNREVSQCLDLPYPACYSFSIMSTADILSRLKVYLQIHAAEYGISRLGVFGSVARGVARPDSDVDVVIMIGKTDLFTLAGIKNELEDMLAAKVDLVPYDERMNTFLKSRIDRGAVYV